VDLLGGRSIPGISIVGRFDYRMAGLPGWVQGRPSGDPQTQLWIRVTTRYVIDGTTRRTSRCALLPAESGGRAA
jgi:hypothetical protein